MSFRIKLRAVGLSGSARLPTFNRSNRPISVDLCSPVSRFLATFCQRCCFLLTENKNASFASDSAIFRFNRVGPTSGFSNWQQIDSKNLNSPNFVDHASLFHLSGIGKLHQKLYAWFISDFCIASSHDTLCRSFYYVQYLDGKYKSNCWIGRISSKCHR